MTELHAGSSRGRRTSARRSSQLDRPGDPSVFGEQTRADAAELIARYPEGQSRSALLPMLHLVQSEQGYVTADGIAFCAERLGSPRPRSPRSRPSTRCTSAARPASTWSASAPTRCAGCSAATRSIAALSERSGVGNNETTADGKITLEHAECLAACDYAPVVTVNYEFFDNQTVGSRPATSSSQLRAGERPMPTRGAPLCSFKQIERQIAGFFDERDPGARHGRPAAPAPRPGEAGHRPGRHRAVLRRQHRLGAEADSARPRLRLQPGRGRVSRPAPTTRRCRRPSPTTRTRRNRPRPEGQGRLTCH